MFIPFYILLIPYAILLVVFFVYSLFNIFHLLRFGHFSIGSIVAITIFITVSLLLLLVSATGILSIDWGREIELNFGLNL